MGFEVNCSGCMNDLHLRQIPLRLVSPMGSLKKGAYLAGAVSQAMGYRSSVHRVLAPNLHSVSN